MRELTCYMKLAHALCYDLERYHVLPQVESGFLQKKGSIATRSTNQEFDLLNEAKKCWLTHHLVMLEVEKTIRSIRNQELGCILGG